MEAVSNNHFDQDGLVSIFALVDPAEAIARRSVLEDVAAAGDFAVCRDRDAARVSMVLSAYAAGTVDSFGPLPVEYPEQTAVLYGELLGRLPELVDHVDRFRSVWAEEDDVLAASEAAIAGGAVAIEEIDDVDLAVVDVPADAPSGGGHRFGGDWVTGLHPMAVNTATSRLVVATRRGRRYDVELRYESWVQLRSRPLRLRRDLVPLAARLQDDERADATWSASPVGGLTPRLTSGLATVRSPRTASSSCSSSTCARRRRRGTHTRHGADAGGRAVCSGSVAAELVVAGHPVAGETALESDVSPARTTAAQISANFWTLPLP